MLIEMMPHTHMLGVVLTAGTALLLKILAGLMVGGGLAIQGGKAIGEHKQRKAALGLEEKKLDVESEAKKAFVKETRKSAGETFERATGARREERAFQASEASRERQARSADTQTQMVMAAISSIMAARPQEEIAEPISPNSPIYNLIRR